MNNREVIKVGIGRVCLTRPPNILQTVLGSCVGLVIYDQAARLAGLAHILLPSSVGQKLTDEPGRYADQAIACLYHSLTQYGAKHLRAKFAGGACMFGESKADGRDVGAYNIRQVRAGLVEYKIQIVAEDVGGNVGRRAEFDPQTAEYTVVDFAKRKVII